MVGSFPGSLVVLQHQNTRPNGANVVMKSSGGSSAQRTSRSRGTPILSLNISTASTFWRRAPPRRFRPPSHHFLCTIYREIPNYSSARTNYQPLSRGWWRRLHCLGAPSRPAYRLALAPGEAVLPWLG